MYPEESHEYWGLVEDILSHDKFLDLKNYYHHNSPIIDHALSVSFLSYLVCKKLNLDYVSSARGGLLHDFFLYDWREYKKDPTKKNHGLNHPKIALDNSRQCFELNEIECDIILKHMWPKVLGWPRYWESLIVSVIDKYCTCNEYLRKTISFSMQNRIPRKRKQLTRFTRYFSKRSKLN